VLGALVLALLVIVGCIWWALSRAPLIDPAHCPWPELIGCGSDCSGPCMPEPACMDRTP
jgi:hypothetical protein